MGKKSGLSIDRACAIMQKYLGRVESMIATVIKDNLTSTTLQERYVKEVVSDLDYQRLPHWAKSKIQGQYQGQSSILMRYLVVFAYDYDGVLHQTGPSAKQGLCNWPLWDEAYSKWEAGQLTHRLTFKQWCDLHQVADGYYWPSGKPYFITPNPLYGKQGTVVTPEQAHAFTQG